MHIQKIQLEYFENRISINWQRLLTIRFKFQHSGRNKQLFKDKIINIYSCSMTPEEYAVFKLHLKETQQKGERMLARISQTIEGVQDTIKQIQDNSDKIDQFKKAYGDVMQQFAIKISASFASPFKRVEGKHYDHLPKELPMKQLASLIMKEPQILIITGAGVSAPSGIPTFRGDNGLYSKKFQWNGKQYEPEQFISNNFYQANPKPIWDWIDAIYQMSLDCKPNKIHTLIDKLSKVLKGYGKNVTIVTQNVDNLHLKPKNNQYLYYAVHGNVQLVRCNQRHLHPYQKYRHQFKAGDEVKCPDCGLPLRPHVLFFDESYGPLYGEEVKDKKFPFVFVIGSSLSTGLCSRFATEAKQVVEINPFPVFEIGQVYQYKKSTQIVLGDILKALGEKK